MDRAPVGFRIRSVRKARGLTQAALAKRAAISPSYLNLIEANKRQIGGALLRAIAAELNVDTESLTGRAELRMVADLKEVALEPLLQRIHLPPDRTPDLVERHPEWASALLTLYRAWRDQAAIVDALSSRLHQDPGLGNALHRLLSHVTAIRTSSEILDDAPDLDDAQRRRFGEIISTESRWLSETAPLLAGLFDQSDRVFPAATPADEVDDFLRQHNGWFPDLEQAGDAIRRTLAARGGTDEEGLAGHLRDGHGITVVRGGAGEDGPNGLAVPPPFDLAAGRVILPADLPRSTRRFRLARRIAGIEAATAIAARLGDALLTGDTSREHARHALASYVAGAVLFPYEEVLRAATACRYDIDSLCRHFDASFEQLCHRLTTLRDPDRPGVPFAFLRADPAGFIGKRFPLPGLPLLRHGHACPLWVVFAAGQTPGRTIRGLVEFPNGARYLMIARGVAKPPAAAHAPPFLHAVMVTCEVGDAVRTVYADGLDLAAPRAAIPVGPGCPLCPRPDCRFRSEDPIVGARPGT
ncbi:MAG: short-chain fatty acyl-CoA regulator family protein [Rhodospirillales bacterium]